MTDRLMNAPPVVSPGEWETARQQLLVKEKAATRARDAIAAERRRMPWMKVEKNYTFDSPKGKVSLLDVFEGRRQLVIYRSFFEPGVYGWPEHACRGCSMMADQVAHVAHLNARDTTFANVSRAPQIDIERLKARMGWSMPWYTILTASTPTSALTNGTAPTSSSATATTCTVHTSSTTVVTRRWEARGATSTSHRSGVRRVGRIHPKAIRRPSLTNGGTGTTRTESSKAASGATSSMLRRRYCHDRSRAHHGDAGGRGFASPCERGRHRNDVMASHSTQEATR